MGSERDGGAEIICTRHRTNRAIVRRQGQDTHRHAQARHTCSGGQGMRKQVKWRRAQGQRKHNTDARGLCCPCEAEAGRTRCAKPECFSPECSASVVRTCLACLPVLFLKLVISEVTCAAPWHGRARPDTKHKPAKASCAGPFQSAASHSVVVYFFNLRVFIKE